MQCSSDNLPTPGVFTWWPWLGPGAVAKHYHVEINENPLTVMITSLCITLFLICVFTFIVATNGRPVTLQASCISVGTCIGSIARLTHISLIGISEGWVQNQNGARFLVTCRKKIGWTGWNDCTRCLQLRKRPNSDKHDDFSSRKSPWP